MAKQVFDLKALSEIDGGRIGIVFDNHLSRCTEDIEDRPADARPREINIKLTLIPNTADDGLLDSVKMQAQVTHKVPHHRSKVFDLGARDGKLVHTVESPEDHTAQPLPFHDEEET